MNFQATALGTTGARLITRASRPKELMGSGAAQNVAISRRRRRRRPGGRAAAGGLCAKSALGVTVLACATENCTWLPRTQELARFSRTSQVSPMLQSNDAVMGGFMSTNRSSSKPSHSAASPALSGAASHSLATKRRRARSADPACYCGQRRSRCRNDAHSNCKSRPVTTQSRMATRCNLQGSTTR